MHGREPTETTGFDPDNAELVETAPVSASGDVTIPGRVCDMLELTSPGLVAFYESDSGEIIIKLVPSASGMAGVTARNAEATVDTPASTLLRAKRDSDQRDLE